MPEAVGSVARAAATPDFFRRLTRADPFHRLDRPLVVCFAALIVIGVTLSMAAAPIAAMRKGIADPFHFTERQLLFLGPAIVIMAAGSLASIRTVERAGILLCAGSVVLMVMALLFGPEIKGASRWLTFAGFGLQPSELFKPGFVILTAWCLANAADDARFPGASLALAAFGSGSIILLLQPDYGQLLLTMALLVTVFFVAGCSWIWVAGAGASLLGILGFGYVVAPHVRSRIDRFLTPEAGDTYQVDTALRTISSGGLLGHDLNKLPGAKEHLPDAHTDFVFAVATEEFGVILGLAIIILFAAIIVRSYLFAARTDDLFTRVAVAGLGTQLGLQAFINIGVNLAVLPAKGMTLPFISYGGSSLIGSGITAGLLLALTRRPDGATTR